MINGQTWSNDSSVLNEERRRYPRLQVAVQIEIRPESTGVPMRLETTDISRGGCYVEMNLTLEVGTKLNMALWLNTQKVNTRGVVVTRHPQFGNGIEFVGMSPENARTLECFLDAQDSSWQVRTPLV